MRILGVVIFVGLLTGKLKKFKQKLIRFFSTKEWRMRIRSAPFVFKVFWRENLNF